MLGRHSNLTVFLHALGQASVPDPHKNSRLTGDVERTYDPSMGRVEAGESGIQGSRGYRVRPLLNATTEMGLSMPKSIITAKKSHAFTGPLFHSTEAAILHKRDLASW